MSILNFQLSIKKIMEEFFLYELSNGIRCIHRQTKSGVARCALMINAGTRDERKGEEGIAHFTEHGFFKGTEHRKAYQQSVANAKCVVRATLAIAVCAHQQWSRLTASA